jgi:hypothetical protein
MPRVLYQQGKAYNKPPKYKATKWMVDKLDSWAVFYHKDVYGLKSPICNPKIKPIKTGMKQAKARQYIKDLLAKEAKDAENSEV